jgi:hypothetical protein
MSVVRILAVFSETILCVALLGIANASAVERPNILLIVSEDNGPEL